MDTLRFIWAKLKGGRWQITVGLLLSVVGCLLALINPYLSKSLVDRAIRGSETELVIPLVLTMFGVVVVKGLIFFIKVILMENASQTMLLRIRCDMFDNLQHQDIAFFDRIRSGDLITRSTGDLEFLRHFVAWVTYCTVDAAVIIVSSFIMLFLVSWQLTLALLAITPFLILTSLLYSKKVRPLYRKNRECLSRINTGASENIDGNRVVKAFAREEYEKEKFDRLSREYRDARLRSATASLKLAPVMAFFSQSLTVIAMLVGGLLCIFGAEDGGNGFTVGSLTLFISVGGSLTAAITNIPNLINASHQFQVSGQKVMEVCEAEPQIRDLPDAISLPEGERLTGEITFRDVSFSFDNGKRVLDHVSFSAQPGETVAVMGPTGCGKTTLVNLLLRFYDVTGGAVLLDGVDVRERSLADIHRSIGVATQDVFLFSDTVDGNIAFSDVSMSEEKVTDCARLAAADGFIRAMSEGYGTIIGERGVGLSGGQKQRVALARALASEPSILVLDDTTSAVDMDTEKYIQYSLRHLPFSCTKIVIAQRISSVRDADKIIILENGHIDIGTHAELAARNAYYREVCELQDVADLPPFTGEPAREGGMLP